MRTVLLAGALLSIAAPAAAQSMDPAMPGMAPAPAKAQTPPVKPEADRPPDSENPHAGHEMAEPGATASDAEPAGTDLPVGDAPAPAPPTDHYADRIFPSADMARVRTGLSREHGGATFSQVMVNLAEYQVRRGRDGYRWDGEAWFGGDINRLTLKSEGEGEVGGGVDHAEVQMLYSRAIDPYFNFQVGLRHDFRPSPTRTYAAIGFEGLAPYMFDVEGTAFVSDKGDVLGRFTGYYDQRITQRLILQPRVEFNLSAQDVPELRLGAGVTDIELGLRLRYEVTREFAPYLGISYDAKTGRTADFARADGKDPSSASLVVGVRFWF